MNSGRPTVKNRCADIDATIGANLRFLRIAKGFSQPSFARELDLSFQQIQKYENGKNRIAASTLYRMADVLGVPLLSFFKGLKFDATRADARAITADETKIVHLYRRLPDSQMRRSIKTIIERLAEADDTSETP